MRTVIAKELAQSYRKSALVEMAKYAQLASGILKTNGGEGEMDDSDIYRRFACLCYEIADAIHD